MNNDEAKFILHGYRPGGRDADDPRFAEALRQVQADPELAGWFARARALDAAISGKLKQAPIPRDLKSSILTGQKVLQPPKWHWGRSIAALAACLAVLIGVAALMVLPLGGSSLGAFRRSMAQMLNTGAYDLDLKTASIAEIQQWLGVKRAHGDFELAAGMKDLTGYGCHVLSWRGKKVSMVCLKTSSGGVVHLFVINRSDLRNPPREGAREFAEAGEWMTASWSQGDKAYVLAGRGNRAELEKFL